ncbi:MAG: hypothetical protein Q8N23_24615 [Archangium sp.]|nr:hypothetical protein [Archangium sp.]MDP3155878.1 hypothetical protein [Archangium sp.]MDP3575412.1 hypothetical protein [Archangium sp.]
MINTRPRFVPGTWAADVFAFDLVTGRSLGAFPAGASNSANVDIIPTEDPNQKLLRDLEANIYENLRSGARLVDRADADARPVGDGLHRRIVRVLPLEHLQHRLKDGVDGFTGALLLGRLAGLEVTVLHATNMAGPPRAVTGRSLPARANPADSPL